MPIDGRDNVTKSLSSLLPHQAGGQSPGETGYMSSDFRSCGRCTTGQVCLLSEEAVFKEKLEHKEYAIEVPSGCIHWALLKIRCLHGVCVKSSGVASFAAAQFEAVLGTLLCRVRVRFEGCSRQDLDPLTLTFAATAF